MAYVLEYDNVDSIVTIDDFALFEFMEWSVTIEDFYIPSGEAVPTRFMGGASGDFWNPRQTSNDFQIKINGGQVSATGITWPLDTYFKVHVYRNSGGYIKVEVDDVPVGSSPYRGDLTTNPIQWFGMGASTFKGCALRHGKVTMNNGNGNIVTYDPSNTSSGTVLPETTANANDGTLVDFDGNPWILNGAPPVGPDITFNGFYDNAFLTADNGNFSQSTFQVEGTINNSAVVSGIEYSFNGGPWTSLITSPADTFIAPAITVTGRGIFKFRSTDEPGTEYVFNNVGVTVTLLPCGQSNIGGALLEAQTVELNGRYAVMIDSSGEPVDYQDVYCLPSYPSAGPAYITQVVNLLTAAGHDVAVIPEALGGTNVNQHRKTQGTLYPDVAARIANTVTKRVNFNFWHQGGSDSATGRETYKTRVKELVTDYYADFGAPIIHIIDIGKSDAWHVTVREVNAEIVSELAFVEHGGSMFGIQDPTKAHLETTAEAQAAALEVYNTAIFSPVSSDLVLSISGIPDGTYMTVLDLVDGTRVQRQNETYASESVTINLPLAAGTTIKGYVDDNTNPSTNGAYIEGITS